MPCHRAPGTFSRCSPGIATSKPYGGVTANAGHRLILSPPKRAWTVRRACARSISCRSAGSWMWNDNFASAIATGLRIRRLGLLVAWHNQQLVALRNQCLDALCYQTTFANCCATLPDRWHHATSLVAWRDRNRVSELLNRKGPRKDRTEQETPVGPCTGHKLSKSHTSRR